MWVPLLVSTNEHQQRHQPTNLVSNHDKPTRAKKCALPSLINEVQCVESCYGGESHAAIVEVDDKRPEQIHTKVQLAAGELYGG